MDTSLGVAGSFGLRERDTDASTGGKRARGVRPRWRTTGVSDSLDRLGWRMMAESWLLDEDESDDVAELVRRIAFVSDDRLGCVGRGCAACTFVCRSGWW